MKGLIAATAVLGVLAIGGLPALALTLAADETATDAEASTTTEDGPPGPPPWSNGQAHGRDGDKADKPEDEAERRAERDERKAERRQQKAQEKAQQKAQRGAPGQPPGVGRHHQGRSPHGWAVREWAHCLAGARAALEEGQQLDPHDACGGKPVSPGHRR